MSDAAPQESRDMNKSTAILAIGTALSLGLVACGSDNSEPVAAESAAVDQASTTVKPLAATDGASPGKPMAPISMDYEIVGNPIVGAPVMINVNVGSGEGPVTVRYSITDTSALMFQQGQEERWQIDDSRSKQSQQIAVIPQREGRLYVNVSAEVETPNGMMIRSIAIPIKVGAAPPAATINGELKEGPDGETVISMPAQQSVPE